MTQAADAYAGFEGRVGRTIAGSEPYWPPRPDPGRDAPNVIVMLADDLGYSDLGCYGGEIDTPHLDALAASGLQYTDFHVTPMCSPTRASLLTGLNSHRAGVGHVCHSDSGYPGYAMELAENCSTVAEAFQDHGWATFMVGKWHLAKDSDLADGPRHSWPCQRGFDRFYGILDGFTNFHHPHRLVRDNSQVDVDRYDDDYYFTDDLTDQAIAMIRESKLTNPDKPFFCYFSHGAVHAPLQAKPEDIARHADAYDAGWDELRAARFARQVEMGIVDPATPLPPRNRDEGDEVEAWDDLSGAEQELFARYMAVYAGMVDNIDQNFGRLRDALEAMGEVENTIILFTSDNGASREGEAVGATGYYVHLIGGSDIERDRARLDLIGGPQTTPHYPRGWAMASNTPFRLYKINTHAGGHRVPMLLSWPAGLDGDSGRRGQYQHVTDVMPTLCEMAGVEVPTARRGRPTPTPAGASFVSTMASDDAPSTHGEQLYEMVGHRGLYQDGWEIVTRHQAMTAFSDDEWELYDLTVDPTEVHDLAAEHPERVAAMAARWEELAWENQVYPLDEGSFFKFMSRPERSGVFGRDPITVPRGTPTLERWRSHELIFTRSFSIDVDLSFTTGDEGYLVAHGDQGGGYGLYALDDEFFLVHNNGMGTVRHLSGGSLATGVAAVGLRADAVGDNSWTITLLVDGEERATEEGFTVLFPMAPFEGIDVGIDRRSPVSWELYERFGPFPWTGVLRSATWTPGAPAPDSPREMIDVLRDMGAQFE